MRSNRIALRGALLMLGLLLCILPPVAAILLYFPVWKHGGADKIISGGALLLIIIAHAPLIRLLRARLKSVAGYTLWLVIFIAFFLLSSIAEEMKVISFVGFVSNLAGAVIMKLAGGMEAGDDE